jgi:beta-lactamase regulating signal transducer with metallopeptidase domain
MMMLVVRVTLLLMIGQAAWLLARHHSASFRHALLMCAVVAALLMPIAPRVTPYSIPVTVARLEFPASSRPFVNAARAKPAIESVQQPPIFAIWLTIAILLVTRTAHSTIAAELLRRRVGNGDVRRTDAIRSAATVGLFRPTVLISTLRAWSDEDLHAAIAHERCHAARRDPAAQLLFDLAAAIYWFHPLMWIVRRLAALDRERACDDAVVSQGFQPHRYAAMLVRLASPARAVGIPISRAGELESRLHAIVDDRPRKPVTPKTFAAIALSTVIAASSIAAVTLALPIDDPLSERLPVVTTTNVIVPASGEDASLLAVLMVGAQKPKTWEGDLVAERSRWALSRARDGALLQPLREALDDRDWRVRAYAAWALAQAGDRESVPRLAALLDDPIWRMRAMAAFGLRAAADPRAADAMLRVRNDSAWQVRTEVAGYLGALRDPRFRTVLETMTADRHPAVRAAAEEALNP